MKKRAFAFACVLVAGCSSDGKPHTIPDSKTTVDALVCTDVTGSALDYAGAGTTSMGGAIFFTGDLGTLDGDPLHYDMEFYQGYGDVSGNIDLSAAPQDSYDTCSVCVIAYTLNTDGSFKRAFFQSGGTMNITTDPVAAKNLNATFTGLKFTEADTSTLAINSNGACLAYADGTVTHDAVPNAWTCDHAKYNSGGSCGCMCGAIDPDCTDTQTAIDGCTGAVACWQGTTCVTTRPANDTCENAQALTTPVAGTPATANGTTIGALHDYNKNLDAATCTNEVQYGSSFSLKGPDVVYKVTLTQGVPYTWKLSALDAKDDLAIAIVGPSATAAICNTGSTTMPITGCVAGADEAGAGADETVSYTPTATGVYYIIVDSYSYNIGGTFTITGTTP
jgi:hypothetical protein